MPKTTSLLIALALVVTTFGCHGSRSGATGTGTPGVTDPDTIRVLFFSRTLGFRHESIEDAKEVFGNLDESEGMEVTITEDAGMFTDATLADYDIALFVNTTGDVLNDDQQAALQRFVRSGKGYVGVHSAADTEHDWPWYGELVGAYFVSHPPLPIPIEVTAEDRTHRSTDHYLNTFVFTDEWYNFDRNPRDDHAVLMTLDEADVSGFIMGRDHPIAWYKEFEGGRSFYTCMGHRPETWGEPDFIRHVLEGIRWAHEPTKWNRIVLTDAPRNPMAIKLAPDGTIYYVERAGEVMEWRPTTGQVREIGKLDVSTVAEGALFGLALDPGFATNRWMYLYWAEPLADHDHESKHITEPGPPGRNILSRFTLAGDGTIDTATRVDILEVPSERDCCHEGADLAFAPDGTLFLSTGDGTDPFAAGGYAPLDERPGRERFNAQRTAPNPDDLRGKILRINPDGSIPAGNMFPADGSAGRPEVYVMGTRNPFRFAVDPAGNVYWGDVGPDGITDAVQGPRGYDEVNFASAPGHYGWPFCVADNIPYADVDFETDEIGDLFDCTGFVPALLAYDYNTISFAVLGDGTTERAGFAGRAAMVGAYYPPNPGGPFALPERFRDTALMTEWTRDVIAAVRRAPDGTLADLTRIAPFEPFIAPIDLEVGPDGAVYVLEFGSGLGGDNADARLNRLEYSEAGALTPVAAIEASPIAGGAPLTVELSATGSRAIGNGDEIVAYRWDLDGDGTTDSTEPTLTHMFTESGAVPVTLRVVGASGRTSYPVVREIVVGNVPPVVTITAPVEGVVVEEGETVQLAGGATDAEDGVAPCDSLTWEVRLGHNAHSHPLDEIENCEGEFTATVGDHGDFESGLFFIAELRYRDQGGTSGEPPIIGREEIRIGVNRAEGPVGSCNEDEVVEMEVCAEPCRDVATEQLQTCIISACSDTVVGLSTGCQNCILDAAVEFLENGIPSFEEGVALLRTACGPGGCSDFDEDGICAGEDNCPDVANEDQADGDDDGWGTACDCADADPAINPGVEEVPGNSIDENCNGDLLCGSIPAEDATGRAVALVLCAMALVAAAVAGRRRRSRS